MKRLMIALLCGGSLLAVPALAQSAQRIRGTITAVDANVLSVRTREGKDVKVDLTDKTTVATAKAISLADLKPGDYVGTTSLRNAEGKLVAREVHVLPATAAEGHTAWDLEPGASMTNARIATAVKSTASHLLTVEYKDGSQTFIVPDGTPIVTTVPADRSALRVGEYVFFGGTPGADGRLTAARIQVSKDGVRPPQ